MYHDVLQISMACVVHLLLLDGLRLLCPRLLCPRLQLSLKITKEIKLCQNSINHQYLFLLLNLSIESIFDLFLYNGQCNCYPPVRHCCHWYSLFHPERRIIYHYSCKYNWCATWSARHACSSIRRFKQW